MDTFGHRELKTLAESPAGRCVSLFMPTHRAGEGTRQDPIRLKNLLREAEARLTAAGLRAPEAKALLAPAQRLLEDGLFWPHQSDGLALFVGPGVSHRYRVPLHFDELLVVSDRFHLRPLLPLLTGDGRFHVLTLSQQSVRLLEGTRHRVDEIDLEGLPRSLAEALKYDDPEKQLQFHTRAPERGGKRAAMFHGQGPGDEEGKDRLRRYFRQIDAGLREFLRPDQVPLVLAGVGYYFPLYREVNTYPHLLDNGVAGSPEALSPEELHQQAWDLVEPYFRAAEEQGLARCRQLAGTGRASSQVAEVLPAAFRGRVDVLFVALGAQRWGTFDPVKSEVQFHEVGAAGRDDLLDLAAVRTFLTGGTVFAVEQSRMPEGSPLAAVFRY